MTRIVQPEVGTGLYQYYIRIIPTEYTDKTGLGNKYLFTNEYTVSEKFRPFFVATGSDGSFVPAPVSQ